MDTAGTSSSSPPRTPYDVHTSREPKIRGEFRIVRIQVVVPTQVGIQAATDKEALVALWTPAFAGVTDEERRSFQDISMRQARAHSACRNV
jgi:hypothetical protein